MAKKDIEKELDKVQDDFQDWKKIYGEVPSGYCEPKDQAKIRKAFVLKIKELQEKLAKTKD